MNKMKLNNALQAVGSNYSQLRKLWFGQNFLKLVHKCKSAKEVVEFMCFQNLQGHPKEQLDKTLAALKGPAKKAKSLTRRQVTDDQIVNLYNSKKMSCTSRDIRFGLSISMLRNMLSASRCYYTGVPLTKDNFSIDRIDSEQGYIKGNVCACDRAFNSWKGVIENSKVNGLTYELGIKGMKKLEKALLNLDTEL